jgi:hypothetical protein
MMRVLVMLCLFMLVCLFPEIGLSKQHSQVEVSLLETRIGRFQIESQSFGQIFFDLAIDNNVPIGFEFAQNDDVYAIWNLQFSGGTLQEFLNQFTAEHKSYQWQLTDGVINISPKPEYRDPVLSEMLTSKISHFLIRPNTGCWEFEHTLASTTELRRIMKQYKLTLDGINYSGTYIPLLGRKFNLDKSDVPAASLLNEVIKGSPVAKMWMIARNAATQTLIINVNAKHEDELQDP